ncbi:MAG: protein SanA [Marinilabiliales bacterium]|nr:MAG: protein SanA [Marinilabiliales bacterium]
MIKIFTIRRIKRLILFVGALLLIVFLADWRIKNKSKDFIYENCDSIPKNKCGVVLGTIKTLKSGKENMYFTYRIDAVMGLWDAEKIDYLIISGDNSREDYNEPQDMKDELVARGFPEDRIYLDFAGFRTWDSMIRMKEIFGQTSFTVISQKFHVERAVFIARHFDLEAIGYNAKDVEYYGGLRTKVREKLARVKVFVDFLFRKKPKYLGDPVIIP